MRKYLIIWIGEVFSTVGSALTSFGLGVWIYRQTGSVSLFSLNLLVYTLCGLLVMPLAGVAADRWNRKLVIIVGDTGAALTSLAVFLLVLSNHLEIWHVYVVTGVGVAFGTFQWPAYKAMVPMIVPPQHLGRASALSQLAEAMAELLGPILAGSLYVMSSIGLKGILFIDFATFLFAMSILIAVPISSHKSPGSAGPTPVSFIQDFKLGWQYIRQRSGLVGLLVYFAIFNFCIDMIYTLAMPLLFEMTSTDSAGEAMSKMAVGMLAGIAVMGLWGGPKRRLHGILIPGILSGLSIALAGLRPSLALITLGGFGFYAMLPIVQSSNQVLWQTKIARAMQGRIFATQSAITASVRPLALLLAGPLADRVFEPLMKPGGLLASSLGQVFDVGPGRGIGLMITILGVLSAVAAGAAYFFPRIRRLEDELPDAVLPAEVE
jgi:MFS family permease